ncbi:hypothetical protein ASF20_11275 [Methylobacterium sp. Leaf88]|nr:hypothetical protein ASF20_11275 [Methylobacterium sp. Leaf88]
MPYNFLGQACLCLPQTVRDRTVENAIASRIKPDGSVTSKLRRFLIFRITICLLAVANVASSPFDEVPCLRQAQSDIALEITDQCTLIPDTQEVLGRGGSIR